ncbi:MAG TPA: cell division protein FtsB [Gammaproteobacteria bacterium]|nr:cell division protein FtsB [Gammaproteobacteria bacterium]
MKLWITILLVLLVSLQVKLWVGEGGLGNVRRLEQAVEAQKQTNQQHTERNQGLAGEVQDLKHGTDAIAERARSELGMIREGETFYQIVEQEQAADE